jgi:hypothetical protein
MSPGKSSQCDSTLRLAEHLGVGTRDLTRIEVVGTPIRESALSLSDADAADHCLRRR